MSRRRRGLTSEDRELWSRYARTAEPLHPPKRMAPPGGQVVPPAPRPSAPLPSFKVGSAARTPYVPPMQAAPALRMDAKTHRRMSAGKLRPEGKLDLHGLTVDQAHPALIRFVLSAQAEGKRLIVVVTGKGGRRREDPLPSVTGVLRRQVPHWLALPPLAGAVLQVSEAHRSHGGAGALYVYLRRG